MSNGVRVERLHWRLVPRRMTGLQECGEPEDGNVEQRIVAAGEAAERGLAMFHCMVGLEMTDQADRIPVVPA